MEIRLTRDNKAVLDHWAQEFQSGSQTPERKQILNAIIHYYFHAESAVFEEVTLARPAIPTSNAYRLKKNMESLVATLMERSRTKSKIDFSVQDLVNILVNHQPKDRPRLRDSIKDYLIDNIKEDPRLIHLDLPVDLVERARLADAAAKSTVNANERLARQLSQMLHGKSDGQTQDLVNRLNENRAHQPPKAKSDSKYVILEVPIEIKQALSRIKHHRFEMVVELLLEESFELLD